MESIQPEKVNLSHQVDLNVLKNSLAGINVGLESFSDSLTKQGAQVLQVDWKPAAGGNERLSSILERLKNK